jgi:hypothetical protein
VVRESDEEVRSRRAHIMGKCDRSKSHLPHENQFLRQTLQWALPHDIKTGPFLPDVLTKLPVNSKLTPSALFKHDRHLSLLCTPRTDERIEFYRKEATDIGSTREAENIAHSLIKNDDLPILIRCRALCILGCSDQGDYLFYAEESVRYAKLGLASDKVGDHKEDELAQLILETCEECLEGAEAAAAKAGSDQELYSDDEMRESEESEVQEDGDDDDDNDEGVVVWDAEWDDKRKAKATADDEARIAAFNDAANMAEGGDEIREAKDLTDDAR